MDSTPDNFTQPGTNPIQAFKKAVRTVISNLSWLKVEDYLSTPIHLFESKGRDVLVKSDKITVFHKLVLFKPPIQRALYELESIKWKFIGFKFFKLCSVEVQMALIKRASYKCFGPGRWILKEGHSPQNMYLIIEGLVRVTGRIYNPAFRVVDTIEHCELHSRQSFGESAVMFDTQRVTSVQSLSSVELISISKIDFMELIKDNLQVKWDENALAIKHSPYFHHLNLTELNECRTVSFIKTFKQNEYVFGRGRGEIDYGHFVIEGLISMVHRLKIMKRIDRCGNLVFTLLNNSLSDGMINGKQNYIDQYMDSCTFLADSCFNVGENMDDKEFMVFDDVDVKCLCVPHWFMVKTEKLKNWTFLQVDLNNIIPDRDTVFQRYVDGKQQNQRKRECTTKI